MENFDPGLAAIVIFICIAAIGLGWVIKRTGRVVEDAPAEIVEEGVTDLKLEPWSPTRGFYWFRVTDLPPAYLKLPDVTPQLVIKQFADDVDDARLKLHRAMIEKAIKARLGIDLAAITAEPVQFVALNRRKGQAHA